MDLSKLIENGIKGGGYIFKTVIITIALLIFVVGFLLGALIF